MIRHVFRTPKRPRTLDTGACDDPFSHPAIRRMSLRELADLPFERR